MCIVVKEADVCATNIFVAPDTKKERQIVVYSNTVDTNFEKNLMVLAVPNPETVDFVDLSEYPEFFESVKNYYSDHEIKTKSADMTELLSNSGTSLKFHEVGNFLASICKNFDELKKINTGTFGKVFGKIDNEALEFIKGVYSDTDYGFVICTLKKGHNNYHPFAYTHKIDNNKLFVPTMHYHGDEKKRIEPFYSDEVYKNKMDGVINKYKATVLDYDWDHNIFIVNNEHDYAKYDRMLDQKMFNKRVNFDIGPIDAISKITKIGKHQNGDTIISVKN